MAITSGNRKLLHFHYTSSQLRYAITYVFVTLLLLIFLNVFCSRESQRLFYQAKETSMMEKLELTASELRELDVLNAAGVESVLGSLSSQHYDRLVITSAGGFCVYDSMENGASAGQIVLLPEIVQALSNCDVFTWFYRDGIMQSHAAMPLYARGSLTGCVYIMENDTEQGVLIFTLQQTILRITIILECAVVLYSLFFSGLFTHRMRKIMDSIRRIRSGDYSQKVDIGGSDELTVLGDEINDLTERLQTSEQKRQQFVSDASHELKTPLASIKLLSDSILQNSMDEETTREFVQDIGNEAERLNRMSQKLLTLTRIDDALPEDSEIIYMAPTVQRVIKMLSPIAEQNGITIVSDLHEDSPVLIIEDDLYQIAFNLAENGLKYNVPGGSLTITLGRTADLATLTVSDTGMGIPEEALPHIFERFYRVDKARSRKSGGSGLGLSIVRNIVHRNGGEIRVSSEVGKGTAFTVTFSAFDVEDPEVTA